MQSEVSVSRPGRRVSGRNSPLITTSTFFEDMVPTSLTTPRRDGKTEDQAQIDMGKLLKDYHVRESEETDSENDRGSDSESDRNIAPPAPRPIAKPKRKARKRVVSPPKSSSSTELQDSTLIRKSARVAPKRSAPQDSDEVEKQPSPTKKVKTTDFDQAAMPPDAAMPPPAKKAMTTTTRASIKVSLKRPAPVASAEDGHAVSPAKVQKHTGRFVPIKSQLKRATKIVKKTAPKQAANITRDADADDADVEDVDEQVEQDDAVGKGSRGKAKKAAPKPFKGTSDMMGSSIQKPEDAVNDEHWKCANRNCTSGQTWHNRDGANSMGRKVISNFFGRNKKETNLIHPDVWHNYCRKDYQRFTYRANIKSTKAKCDFYIDNIQMQIHRLKLWRPEAQFHVQLSKGAKTRLGNYYKELSKNGNDVAKATKSVEKTAQVNAKGKEKPLALEDAFPTQYLKHFDDSYEGADQSFDDIDAILTWVQGLVNAGDIDSMPPVEFLVNQQHDDERVLDPKYNYDRWAAFEDGTEFVSPDGSEADDEQETEDGESDEKTEDDVEDAVREQSNNDLSGLTDDDSSDSDASESDVPATPTMPPKKYRFFLTGKGGARPLSSTYGATLSSGISNKRKRSEVDEDEGEGEAVDSSTPSKKQK